MTYILLGLVASSLLGLGLGALSFRQLRRRRLAASGANGALAVFLLAFAAVVASFTLNLHTYRRLTHEQEVAILRFDQLAPQYFRVTVRYPGDGGTETLDLRGDEWQLDARVLKWHGAATVLGLDARYRLERLSGRYRSAAEEQSRPRSVHPLAEDRGLDLWSIAQRHRLPWVDAVYGSATYLPMRDRAQFEVRLAPTGLVARPANAPATAAVRGWE